jgi:hypothetical protein
MFIYTAMLKICGQRKAEQSISYLINYFNYDSQK